MRDLVPKHGATRAVGWRLTLDRGRSKGRLNTIGRMASCENGLAKAKQLPHLIDARTSVQISEPRLPNLKNGTPNVVEARKKQ